MLLEKPPAEKTSHCMTRFSARVMKIGKGPSIHITMISDDDAASNEKG